MLLLIPLLSGQVNPTFTDAFFAVGKAVIVLGAVLLFAHYGLNRFMATIVRTKVSELLLLTTLVLCMGLAMLTAWLGLSLSLGAFLAGLFLARSEYSMSVVAGVLPYRDVFMSIFFISVGMLLDVNHIANNASTIFIATIIFIFIKSLLVLPAVLIQKYPLHTAIIVGLTLAQVGEFSFVLANAGIDAGLLDNVSYQNFLAISIITMMLTPCLMYVAPRLAKIINQYLGKSDDINSDEISRDKSHLENHLIIVGFGISGQHLARAAKDCSIPYEILEMNPDTVHRYQNKEPIMYGDASRPSILEHMGITKAKVLAIVISDPAAVQATVAEAIKLNPSIRIIARSRFLAEVNILRKLGASSVIAEEFESSIEVFSRVLHQYMIPKQDIDALVTSIRQENYSMLRKSSQKSGDLGGLLDQLPNIGVHAIRLEKDAPLSGKNLIQSELRQLYGVTVVAIQKGEKMIPSPEAEILFDIGDIVYLFGDEVNLSKASKLMRSQTNIIKS